MSSLHASGQRRRPGGRAIAATVFALGTAAAVGYLAAGTGAQASNVAPAITANPPEPTAPPPTLPPFPLPTGPRPSLVLDPGPSDQAPSSTAAPTTYGADGHDSSERHDDHGGRGDEHGSRRRRGEHCCAFPVHRGGDRRRGGLRRHDPGRVRHRCRSPNHLWLPTTSSCSTRPPTRAISTSSKRPATRPTVRSRSRRQDRPPAPTVCSWSSPSIRPTRPAPYAVDQADIPPAPGC